MHASMARHTVAATRPLTLMVLLVVGAPAAAQAQSPEEKEVVAVIETFFAGMLAKDTAMMNGTVDPAARLVRVSQRQGEQPAVGITEMSRFIAGVGRREGEGANERIHNPVVQIDGNMAHVWTFYTLHLGERFSHCGYDSFQLLRLPDGWKIVNVADTGRTENCEVPGR